MSIYVNYVNTYLNNEETTLIYSPTKKIEFHPNSALEIHSNSDIQQMHTSLHALLNFKYFTHTLITNFEN